MTEGPRRERPWWRSRRLVALIVVIDVLGVAALAYALTTHKPTQSSPAVTASEVTAETLTAIHQQQREQRQAAQRAAARRARRHRPPAPATGAPVPATSFSATGAQASFARFAATQPGSVGLAVSPLGANDVVTFGSLQLGHGWSTMKVPVLATLLEELAKSGKRLDVAGQDDATRALHASDNSAAEALFARLEQSDGGLDGASAAVQDTLRRAGDTATSVNTAPNASGFTTWGQTQWSATAQVTFYRALAAGCLLSQADTGYVLGLMRGVESDQRWGAGSAGYPASATLGFKGGWGPEDGGGYLVRQSAIVSSGPGRGWVLSYLAKPSDGSFGTGTQMLSALATWAARTFPVDSPPAGGGSCG